MAHNYANARAFANACLASNVGYTDQSNSVYSGQCVALIKNFYNLMTTVPTPFGARGNGKDVAQTLINQGYAIKLAKPQTGAVLSYPGTASNPYGHVALAISETEMVEQNSAYIPNNGTNANGTYKPRICAIRAGYTTIALPQGYYEDAPSTNTATSGSSTSFGGSYKVMVDTLNVRDKASTSGAVKADYKKGQIVNLENTYYIADGYVWGTYISNSGVRRYIAVGKNTGKAESDDYLVKV